MVTQSSARVSDVDPAWLDEGIGSSRVNATRDSVSSPGHFILLTYLPPPPDALLEPLPLPLMPDDPLPLVGPVEEPGIPELLLCYR